MAIHRHFCEVQLGYRGFRPARPDEAGRPRSLASRIDRSLPTYLSTKKRKALVAKRAALALRPKSTIGGLPYDIESILQVFETRIPCLLTGGANTLQLPAHFRPGAASGIRGGASARAD